MLSSTFIALVTACAPQVNAGTASALIAVESGFNPYAIGVVGGALGRQPHRRAEALATARALRSQGVNFSVGLAQINARNFERLGLTTETAFDPCANLAAMQTILPIASIVQPVGKATLSAPSARPCLAITAATSPPASATDMCAG